MLAKTIQFNKKTAVGLVLLISAVLIVLVLLFAGDGIGEMKALSRGRSNEGRVQFLSDCGWEVEEQPISEKTILIPKEFSEILEEYNELQKASGFDLSEYAGVTVQQYIYRVLNYSGYDGEVEAVLYVSGARIIGGDIHAAAIDGFMHGLR